jgi:hypothetical protein
MGRALELVDAEEAAPVLSREEFLARTEPSVG